MKLWPVLGAALGSTLDGLDIKWDKKTRSC